MSDEPPVNEASKLQNSQTKNSGEEGSIQMVPINRDDAQGKFLSTIFVNCFWNTTYARFSKLLFTPVFELTCV